MQMNRGSFVKVTYTSTGLRSPSVLGLAEVVEFSKRLILGARWRGQCF